MGAVFRRTPFFGFVFTFLLVGFVFARPVLARSRWTELNVGPFYVATDHDPGEARDVLTQLEQVRWVLGGLLESKDLPSIWPIHILLTTSGKTNPNSHFASQNTPSLPLLDSNVGFVPQNGRLVLVFSPGAPLPLGAIAGILLDANTPRLPPEVESGLRQLFATLEAKGSRVTWGGRPLHPDLGWARMQLFATKFEYTLSFHILLNALKGGSTLQAAEKNAFAKDPAALEAEAAANLAAQNWEPVSVSGRPLDPKRDFGEHSLTDTVADVYLADAKLGSDPHAAQMAYQSAVNTPGPARSLGYEGLAAVNANDRRLRDRYLDQAMHAGSQSAAVYAAASENLRAADALPLLKKAAQLNPLWGEPIFRQADLTDDPKEKEALLRKAVGLDPRNTAYWIELAHVQIAQGEATAAQGSWLRAEDSAPTDAEHDRVHQLRLASEQERLDAADEARRRDREAAHVADQRAQDSESDRIKAAEARANGALDAAAGGAKAENPVPWSQTIPQKTVKGALVKVECIGKNALLLILDDHRKNIPLFLARVAETSLACGDQKPNRRVVVTYSDQSDDENHTAGAVTKLQIQ